MQEMWVQSLGREDPLEEDMAIYSSFLAGKIPWAEEHGRLQTLFGVTKEADMTKHSTAHLYIIEGPHNY